jgi:hypothetical protein
MGRTPACTMRVIARSCASALTSPHASATT